MRRDARPQPRAFATICLAAFLLLMVVANVHVHGWPGCHQVGVRGVAYYHSIAFDHHCAACELFYSGASSTTFTPAFTMHRVMADASFLLGAETPQYSSTSDDFSSRAPPDA
jgi:hypothetical protein